jgi:hypothetical protein
LGQFFFFLGPLTPSLAYSPTLVWRETALLINGLRVSRSHYYLVPHSAVQHHNAADSFVPYSKMYLSVPFSVVGEQKHVADAVQSPLHGGTKNFI